MKMDEEYNAVKSLADKFRDQVHWTHRRAEIAEDERDKYGVTLMSIAEGCADPVGVARRILWDLRRMERYAPPDANAMRKGDASRPFGCTGSETHQ